MARDPRRDEAFKIYKKNKGNISLVEIANQLSVSDGTVRGWKSKDKWEQQLNGTFQNETKKKRSVPKGKSPPNNKKIEKPLAEVEQVLDNPDLTDKQRLFCLYMVKYFNATKAYQKAYGCDYWTAAANANRLLKNAKILEEIQNLKLAKLNQATLEPGDIFQKYMDIAFSDITDYLTFGKKTIEYVDKNGMDQEAEVSYVDLNNSCNVDGTLITEVKQGKDGISIKLADRMKALQWIADHMDLATEEQRIKIAKLNKELGESNKEPIKIEFVKASERGASNE